MTTVVSRKVLVAAAAVLLTSAAWGSPLHSSGAAFTSSSTNAPSQVTAASDWTPPTVSLLDPGSPLKGTVAMTAEASDGESGVASVTVEYAAAGGTTWLVACAAAVAPYTCSWNTTGVGDGPYDLRARAADKAGYTATSTVIKDRQVGNTVSSVALNDPGANLRGTISLSATASSTAGVRSVAIQRAPAGSSTWSTVCTLTVSPYTCSWSTAAVPDGLYDLRAVLVDGRGMSTTSSVLSNRRVDNTAPRGVDVQVTNRGGESGRAEAGDVITFTYSEVMDLASIYTGWNGADQSVTVSLANDKAGNDTLEVAAVNLGTLNLKGNYVEEGNVQFSAQMSAKSVTVNGAPGTEVSIILGSPNNSRKLLRSTVPSSMEWAPSAVAKDLAGNPARTDVVMEAGTPPDSEF